MLQKEVYENLVRVCLEEAEMALARGDDPFGAVLADAEGNIIVRGGNSENTEQNPSAHAEMILIREACKKLGKKDLSGLIAACNAESCPMCAAALLLAGVKEFYVGAEMEPSFRPYVRMRDMVKAAGDDLILVEGVLKEECTEIMVRAREIHKAKGTLPLYALRAEE